MEMLKSIRTNLARNFQASETEDTEEKQLAKQMEYFKMQKILQNFK